MRAVLLTWAWTTMTSPREALDGFFRRRGEAGKFYCAACLAQRLRRGVGAFPPAAVKAAVADASERPGLLRVKPRGPLWGLQESSAVYRRQYSRGWPAPMTYSLVVSLLLTLIGVVLWSQGGPTPRTWAAWLTAGGDRDHLGPAGAALLGALLRTGCPRPDANVLYLGVSPLRDIWEGVRPGGICCARRCWRSRTGERHCSCPMIVPYGGYAKAQLSLPLL
jgi:hypothetical protein